jgi:hypothetical protein
METSVQPELEEKKIWAPAQKKTPDEAPLATLEGGQVLSSLAAK